MQNSDVSLNVLRGKMALCVLNRTVADTNFGGLQSRGTVVNLFLYPFVHRILKQCCKGYQIKSCQRAPTGSLFRYPFLSVIPSKNQYILLVQSVGILI